MVQSNQQKVKLNNAVSLFNGISPKVVGTGNWQSVLHDFSTDKYKSLIEKVREKTDPGQYRNFKKRLPGVTFAGTFSHRDKKSTIDTTGFIIPDLDHLDSELETIFELLCRDENIHFVFKSPSGKGIKAALRAEGIKTNEDHKAFYLAVERYFNEVYGITIDPACKDICRLTFVSYDPNLYVNEDPYLFDITRWTPEKKKTGYNFDFNTAPTEMPISIGNNGWKAKYGAKVLEGCCNEIGNSQPGNQHNIRLKMARLIGGYIPEFISEDDAYDALESAVEGSGAKDIISAMKTIGDGIENGKLNPIIIEEKNLGKGTESPNYPAGQIKPDPEDDPEEQPEWEFARDTFPRNDFPWDSFPVGIADSIKQLARAHATSVLPLPGTAMAVLSSVIGSTITVSPKAEWQEPLIIWHADIRPSGEGKTPSSKALGRVIYQAQSEVQKKYGAQCRKEETKDKKDREQVPRPRGYYVTDLTLEGLREDIDGHGGKICIMDEISSFVSSQNQYKSGKGNDREGWICLWDGNPARILRAGRIIYVEGARVSISGGIQPDVWKKTFGGEDGIYLQDGTIFRFLVVYENEKFYPLTSESWEDRSLWETTLKNAMQWADGIVSQGDDWKTHKLSLTVQAQQHFFYWRNDIFEKKMHLPLPLKGFIPKMISYSLRLAGVIHCLDQFAVGATPKGHLDVDDIRKGINMAQFYMGHAVDATKTLITEGIVIPFDIDEQVTHLAKTLDRIRADIDSGRLAVGYIQKKFNEDCKPELAIKSARATGSLLKRCGLKSLPGNYDANGKRRAKCILWDKKTDELLKKVSNVSNVS